MYMLCYTKSVSTLIQLSLMHLYPVCTYIPTTALVYMYIVYCYHTLSFCYMQFSDSTVVRSSEQLKLFYLVYSGFKTIFQEQVESSQFHAYDAGPKVSVAPLNA